MSPSPELPADAEKDRAPAELVEVGRYASADAGFERGLVALALGTAFWLMPAEGGYRLMVHPSEAPAVREEIARFERESAGWPPREPPAPVRGGGPMLATPLVWAVVEMASFRAQRELPGWVDAGALDSAALWQRGEWWRPFTALFLHADLGHLVSNLLSGVFVFSAVLTTLGRARGWLLLAAAAIAGNLVAAAVRAGETYRSVGASTAVFAALGLLTGHAVRRILRHGPRTRWRAVFAPLASGIVVLALFGAGEVRIDVIAHATGFGAGLLFGLATSTASREHTARGSGAG